MEEARTGRGDSPGDLGRSLAAATAGKATISPRLAADMPAALPLSRGGNAMQSLPGAALQRPSPQAALSIEISRLVARVLKGETIDIAATGDELAFRFPDAGMTGAMIAEAIQRAAGMVGMIREGAIPDVRPLRTKASRFDDELAAAIDAGIGEIVAGQAAPPHNANGDGAVGTDGDLADKSSKGLRGFMRRTFFRG